MNTPPGAWPELFDNEFDIREFWREEQERPKRRRMIPGYRLGAGSTETLGLPTGQLAVFRMLQSGEIGPAPPHTFGDHFHQCPNCQTEWACSHPECQVRDLKRPTRAFCRACEPVGDDAAVVGIAAAVLMDALDKMEWDVENLRFCTDEAGDFAQSRDTWCNRAGVQPHAFFAEAKARHAAFLVEHAGNEDAMRETGRRVYVEAWHDHGF